MKKNLSVAINVFVGVMSLAAWLFMSSYAGGSALSAGGLSSLKFFTVLSNLLNGGVCLAYAVWQRRGVQITTAKKTLKLVATSAVGLTFMTVMVFLAPLYGFAEMMEGSNLWFHLLLPLVSFFNFAVLERGVRIPLAATLWAVVPPALYSAGYVANIAINGFGGPWPDSNDFYGFLNWGNAVGAVIALSILLITWLVALALCAAGGAIERKAA